MSMIRRVVGILALGVAELVFAQTPMPQGGADVPLGLSQKQGFARGLLDDASLVRRIQASKDVEAQRLLALAGDAYTSALAAIKGGDFGTAEKQLNESMSAIGKARRRIPDVAALAAKQRADYQQLLESVDSLQKSYLSYLKRAKQPFGALENEAIDATKLVDVAKANAIDDHLGDALQGLEKAERVMKAALGRILGATLLEFTQKFKTQAEEYSFELDRNRSYLELIPVAIAELRPTDDAKQTIETLVEQDRASVDLAGEYARLQDYNKALANIRTGTGYLQLALSTAGIVLSKGASAE